MKFFLSNWLQPRQTVSFQGILSLDKLRSVQMTSDDEIGDEHGLESEVADVRLTSVKINPVEKPVRSDSVDTGYIRVCCALCNQP